MNVALVHEASGALTVEGTPTTLNLLGGQNVRLTFTGTAGQWLGLAMNAS